MTQPKKKPRPLNAGRSFQPTGDPTHGRTGRLKRGVWCNKFARRIERRKALRQSSRIEMAIAKSRRILDEAQSLATNSHEARRYIEALRKERDE